VPDTPGTAKFPLVIIGHGQHRAVNGESKEVLSYKGYEKLQDHLATNGIASFSINLFFVNLFENNEQSPFKKLALDFNQRILHFFLHLKLLRILAGEPLSEPSSSDEFPIKFLDGSVLKNITEVLGNTTSPNAELTVLRNALANRIDFGKVGFMGHSRGADAVARVPAYFYKGTTPAEPTFPVHPEVDRRIKKLSGQIGKPEQDTIKCILALEPTAMKNEVDPRAHGYVIDNKKTMFFLGTGTHDEDVSLDAVSMYEHPVCHKAMVTINGATHYRFNSIWADDYHGHDFDDKRTTAHRFSKEQHGRILELFGACFIGTLTKDASQLLIHKETEFPSNVVSRADLQCAWKFSFPFESDSTITELDASITALSSKDLTTSAFKFEQEITTFYLEKSNAGTFTLTLPVDTALGEPLPLLGQFSFRFAKGFDLSFKPDHRRKNHHTVV
jgi:hypothetical protein